MVSLMRDSDKKVSSILEILNASIRGVTDLASRLFEREMTALTGYLRQTFDFAGIACDNAKHNIDKEMEVVLGLHPKKILQQGFSIARHSGQVVSRASGLMINEEITLDFYDGSVSATITSEPILKEKPNE
jgi:exonuclease VII large subunit